MSVRGRGFRVLAITVLVGLFALPEVPAAMAFSRVGSLTLNPGETGLYAAVIDSANGFAYFAADQRTVVKIRLSDFTRVGALTLDGDPESAVIDAANGYAYFGTSGSPGVVVKVRLSDFTQVAALTLNAGEYDLGSAVIDSGNGFAYFGTFITSPAVVVKVRLSDFTRVGALTVNTGGNYLSSAVIDSVNGFAYFGTTGLPGAVVKIRLSDLTYVGSLTLYSGETGIGSAVIDSANGYAYFGTYSTSASLSVVVKVRLSDFARVGSLTLNPGESGLTSAVIDSASGFAYFGTNGSPGVVVKVRLSDFTRVGALTLNTGEDFLRSAVIDAANGFAYFGTLHLPRSSPGLVVKVATGGAVSPPPKYPVSFTQTGLPTGTSWSVTLNGTTLTSTTSTIAISEANGTYVYTVGSVAGHTASPSSGSVTVNGGGVNVPITFSAVAPTIFGLDPPVFFGVTAVVIAIAVAGVVVAIRRKKSAVR